MILPESRRRGSACRLVDGARRSAQSPCVRLRDRRVNGPQQRPSVGPVGPHQTPKQNDAQLTGELRGGREHQLKIDKPREKLRLRIDCHVETLIEEPGRRVDCPTDLGVRSAVVDAKGEDAVVPSALLVGARLLPPGGGSRGRA